MNRGSKDDTFGQESRGRIPGSLIDAALDGEICDQMQEEIAHALRYDHARRAELLETADAVRALDLEEIPMPDMQCAVLNQLDRHDRFMPRAMRRWVRTGRLAIAAGVLLGLMLVAGLQSMYPRLTTIGSQSTPVDDVASAMAEDSQRMVDHVQSQVEHVRASISPLEGLLSVPQSAGAGSFTLTMNHQVFRLSDDDIAAFCASGVGELQTRYPSRARRITLVSYGGPNGQLLMNSGHSSGAHHEMLIHSERVELESSNDERIADLP